MKKSESNFLKLKVKAVLIDMDDTITFSKNPELVGGDAYLEVLVSIVGDQQRISGDQALITIRQAGDPSDMCLFALLPDLGVSREVYWRRMQAHLSGYLELYEDAAELLKGLAAKGIRVFPATSNSRMSILSKLAVFNLASMNGSPYFTEVFGGSEICPGGKCSPAFFPSLLKRFNLDPATTLMIGDDPGFDLSPARAAGIEQVVLVQRSRQESVVQKPDGGIYVNSLKLVLEGLNDE